MGLCVELCPNLLLCVYPRRPASALDSVVEYINHTALGIVAIRKETISGIAGRWIMVVLCPSLTNCGCL